MEPYVRLFLVGSGSRCSTLAGITDALALSRGFLSQPHRDNEPVAVDRPTSRREARSTQTLGSEARRFVEYYARWVSTGAIGFLHSAPLCPYSGSNFRRRKAHASYVTWSPIAKYTDTVRPPVARASRHFADGRLAVVAGRLSMRQPEVICCT
jgi:hypothetical protein